MMTNLVSITIQQEHVFDMAGHMIKITKDKDGSYILLNSIRHNSQQHKLEIILGERLDSSIIRFIDNKIIMECGNITYQIKDMYIGYLLSVDMMI